jgi:Lipid A 3-O-deacylase (PagL)
LLSARDALFFAAMNFGIRRVRSFFSGEEIAPSSLRPGIASLTYWIYLALLLLAPLFVSGAEPEEFQFHSVGARVGFPAENTSNHFRQADTFLDYNLWRWNLNENWRLQSRLEISAGWLWERGDDSFVGTLGPKLELSRERFPVSLEGGSSPTYISRYHFSSTDLGANVQFTSHIGLFWDITSHWRVGYRFEHMSNAGLRKPNPGFNLHVLSVGYVF